MTRAERRVERTVRTVLAPRVGTPSRLEPVGTIDDGAAVLAARASTPGATARRRWLAACAARLTELRPGADRRQIDRLAAGLWRDAGSFDPVIAAEMESESSRGEGRGA